MGKKTRHGDLTEDEAEQKIGELLVFTERMTIVSSANVLLESFQAACHFSHSANDTAFLALAESQGIPLVTADEKFYHKVRLHAHVILLRNLEIG